MVLTFDLNSLIVPSQCLGPVISASEGTMSPQRNLTHFTPEELKHELLARGASVHARIAAEMTAARGDLGGNAELTKFSSQDLVKTLRKQQKVLYGVDGRTDIFDVTNKKVLQNAD